MSCCDCDEFVTGAGTGVDNHVVRWDGTSAIQSSGWILDDSDNMQVPLGGKILFRDTDNYIYSSAVNSLDIVAEQLVLGASAELDIFAGASLLAAITGSTEWTSTDGISFGTSVSGSSDFYAGNNRLTINFNGVNLYKTTTSHDFSMAAADTDVLVNFIGTTNSGVLTWMEDEDYFKFSDDILMNSTEAIYFSDTSHSIAQASSDLVYNTVSGFFHRFKVNSTTEVVIGADTMVFQSTLNPPTIKWATNGTLEFYANGLNLDMTLTADNLTFDNGATDTAFNWSSSGVLRFTVAAANEISFAADSMTFNNGATTTGLDWTTSGSLGLLVGGTVAVAVGSKSMSFEAGAVDVGLGWGTSGNLTLTVAGATEVTLTADNLTFANGATTTAFNWTTSGRLDSLVGAKVITQLSSLTLGVIAGSSTTYAKAPGIVADFIADVGNGTTVETDIFTYTTPSNMFLTNGDKAHMFASINIVGHATATRQIKAYFAGTAIFDSGALTLATNGNWKLQIDFVRTTSTTARTTVILHTAGTATEVYTTETDLTTLTLSGTNILKFTGTAGGVGAATNDIVGKHGYIQWMPAA